MRELDTAMILAAGMGSRLRPLTDTCPKPLLPIGGVPVIFRTLDMVAVAGVRRVVINTHYLATMLEDALLGQLRMGRWGPLELQFSREETLLETGGGLKKAAPLLQRDAVLVINSDAMWDDARVPLLQPLLTAWNLDHTGALLAMVPTTRTHDFQPRGDFKLGADGCLSRDGDRNAWGHIYAGVHMTTLAPVCAVADDRFSLNVVWDTLRVRGLLHGWVYDAPWVDMGTPAGMARAETLVGR